jgi:hypothetical protein
VAITLPPLMFPVALINPVVETDDTFDIIGVTTQA